MRSFLPWVLLAAIAIGLATALRSGRVRTEELRWRNGTVELAGTLHLPSGEGPHPAAVFLHGWGDWTRSEKLFAEHARRLSARAGLALLIFDKRGCGESSGDWRSASFQDLADDALGGAALLRADPRIRADRVGLLGTSLGGSIALLAASRAPEIAFVAALSLSTRSPAEHAPFLVETNLRRKGHSEADAARAAALERAIRQVYRRDAGWDEARAAVVAARAEPWFEDAEIELHPRESAAWRWLRDLPMDLDPIPLLEALEIPLFVALGREDWLVPAEREREILESIAARRARDFTVVVIPGAGHTLRLRSGWPSARWTWPESYWEALEGWLDARVVGAR